jgi:hypothetical protein
MSLLPSVLIPPERNRLREVDIQDVYNETSYLFFISWEYNKIGAIIERSDSEQEVFT